MNAPRSLALHAAHFVTAAALVVGTARAGVIVVQGDPSLYDELQVAVDAAVDGDILFVRGTDYVGGAVIDGKALTVIADAVTGPAACSGFWIRNIPAGKSVALQGFSGPNQHQDLRVTDCAGSVRVAACDWRAFATTFPASVLPSVELVNAEDVALQGCLLRGGLALTPYFEQLTTGPALRATNSRVALHDCTTIGARGANGVILGGSTMTGGGIGSDALDVVGGELLLSGGSVTGGEGGTGVSGGCLQSTPGGRGGDGLTVSNGALVHVLDCPILPGNGGANGTTSCGGGGGSAPAGSALVPPNAVLDLLVGTRRSLDTPPPFRDAGPGQLVFHGAPGDRVFLLLSSLTEHAFEPLLHGTRLVRSSARRLFVGMVDGSGTCVMNTAFPDLGPGVLGTRRFVQGILVDPAGERYATGSAALVVVDASL